MQGNGGTNLPAVDFPKTTFLVANDKAYFRDMVHTALTRMGARDVRHAASVETAVEILNRLGQTVGCIVCDWDMAPVAGLELLRMVRCRTLAKTPPRTPVVILTARADSNAVKSAVAMDVNGFAVAPLSFEKLIKTITTAVGRSWTLQSAGYYAAVPSVAPTSPEGAQVSGKDIIRRPEPTEAPHAGPPAVNVMKTGKPQPRRDVELKNVQMCTLSQVKPGAILARDIIDRNGQLLLKTGTELRPSLINRLRDVAQDQAESYHVWVGERGEGH